MGLSVKLKASEMEAPDIDPPVTPFDAVGILMLYELRSRPLTVVGPIEQATLLIPLVVTAHKVDGGEKTGLD
jgi:hypothetical protein